MSKSFHTAMLLLGVSLIALSLPAVAQDDFYVGVQGGLTSPTSPDDFSDSGITATFDADLGYNVGLVAGKSFNALRAEIELTHRASDVDATITDGVTTDQGSTSYTAQAAMANLYLDMNRTRSVIPYIGAGLGVVRAESDDFETTNFGAEGNTDTSLAYQAMLGVNAKVSDHTVLNIGARYFGAQNDVLPESNYELVTGLNYRF